ncbi:MAG: tetratricopeptide repeat protein [Acidobacteria bacterium]|nr:tetratricopeptide repeat protein [Acidobacteriota bacterium]
MVWQQSDVGTFTKEKFVNVRIDTSDDDYDWWREKFQTPGTPTVLFLDAEGNEIDRFVGFGGKKDETFQMVKDFAAGINTLPALLVELDAKPEDVDINFKLAEKYQMRYEIPKAHPFYEKVLSLDPADTRVHKEEATYQVALYTARTNQDPEPLKAYIAAYPDDKDHLLSAYTTIAGTYQRKQEMDKVVETYEEAMKALPDNARLHYSYAGAIFNGRIEDKYDLGLKLNAKAKELDPEMERSTVYNLMSYYRNTDNKTEMINLLDGALAKWPTMAYTYASTVTSMEIEDKYNAAMALLQTEIKKDENAKAGYMWFTLGQLFLKKGDKKAALEHMKKAVELTPEKRAARYIKAVEDLEKEMQQK